MSVICPTITPNSPDMDMYDQQMAQIQGFAQRVQIDLMDGDFAPNQNTAPADIWWPSTMAADIHVMYRHPVRYLDTLIAKHPSLVILHAEAEDNVPQCFERLRENGIRCGVAILKNTPVATCRDLIAMADHVLLFSGDLGFFGGTADLNVLLKVPEVRDVKEDIEIGWDGGANIDNARLLSEGGIDVINAGGAIHRAADPLGAYMALCKKLV